MCVCVCVINVEYVVVNQFMSIKTLNLICFTLRKLDLKWPKLGSLSPPTGRTGELMKTDSFDMWGGGEYVSEPFCFEHLKTRIMLIMFNPVQMWLLLLNV